MRASIFGKFALNCHTCFRLAKDMSTGWVGALGLLVAAPLQAATPAAGTATAPATVSAPAAASTAKPADAGSESRPIDRDDFTLSIPLGWKEDTQAKDYDANANFTLFSPKSSSLQFVILSKMDDPKKIVDNAVKKIDGVQITTLSKTNLLEWFTHKGTGQYLKGKIVDSFPGSIKVFCFSSVKHNVLVIETTFSDDIKDTQDDIKKIGESFKMKAGL